MKSNKFLQYGILFFCLVCITIHPAFASKDLTTIIKEIESLNLSLPRSVIYLEKVLNQNKLFPEMKITECILRLPDEELLIVKENAQKMKTKKISRLLDDEVVKRKKPEMIEEFNYFERTLVGTKPLSDISCTAKSGPQYIRDLNPERFYFDEPDLYLTPEEFQLDNIGRGLWSLPFTSDAVRQGTSIHSGTEIRSRPRSISSPRNAWHFVLPSNFFMQPRYRLWNQRYEETALFPYYYDNRVFIQNYYRIYCIDVFSGTLLWTFSPPSQSGGHERLARIRFIWEPEPSYLFTVHEGVLYAEVAGSLIGLDITAHEPEMIWQVPLGQYTIASKPHVVNRGVFVALINRRGELWGAMFDTDTGRLLWDSFIGITTKVSPASDLVTDDGNVIYFVSNRGLTAALDTLSGNALWIYEYPMKQYSITDVWGYIGGGRKDFTETPHDTSLIEIRNDSLLFKPRDSKYIYLCEKQTGAALWHILLEGTTVLFYHNDLIFVLRDTDIISIDLVSGEETDRGSVIPGTFRGGILSPAGMYFFKVDAHIYQIIPSARPGAKLIGVSTHPESWLKNTTDEGIYFECQHWDLFCYRDENVRGESSYLRLFKEEKDSVDFSLNDGIVQMDEDDSLLHFDRCINRDIISSGELTRLVRLCAAQNKTEYIRILSEKMCLHNDIYMRTADFIDAIAPDINRKGNNDSDGRTYSGVVMEEEKTSSFTLAEGEKLQVLTIKNDSDTFPYFFVIKNDQLLCVRKADGEIVWWKFIIGYRTNRRDRRYPNSFLTSSVYDNTLVIFDGINLFGVDVHTGNPQWFISDNETHGRQLLRYLHYPKTEKGPFLYGIAFTRNRLIYFKKGTLYFIDPRTGYCYSKTDTGHRFIAAMKSDNGYVFCLFLPASTLEVYDMRTGKKINVIDVKRAVPSGIRRLMEDPSDEHKTLKLLHQLQFSFCVKYPYYYLQLSTGLWSFDVRTQQTVLKKDEFRGQKNWIVSNINGRITSISPLSKVIAWEDGLKRVAFTHDLCDDAYKGLIHTINQQISGTNKLHSLRKSKFLHSCGNALITLSKMKDGFYLIAFDKNTGKKMWDAPVTDAYPHLWHVSNSILIGNNICLTVSVKRDSNDWIRDQGYVHTVFMAIEGTTGKLITKKVFPLAHPKRYLHSVSKINTTVIINENDERLRAERLP